MCETNDGFKIADADLKLRGPGDFFGSKQHGLPTLKIASIFDDMSVLKETQRLAKRIDLSNEKYLGLKNAALRLFESAKGGLN